jgi:hypothetical protein
MQVSNASLTLGVLQRAALDKEKQFFILKFFAKCLPLALGKACFLFLDFHCRVLEGGTRQSIFFNFLCRVPWPWHSAKLGT